MPFVYFVYYTKVHCILTFLAPVDQEKQFYTLKQYHLNILHTMTLRNELSTLRFRYFSEILYVLIPKFIYIHALCFDPYVNI